MFVLDTVNKIKSSGGGFSTILQSLANQRTDVNGQMIASNAVLDNLVNENVLTKAQATELKKYKFDGSKLVPIKTSTSTGRKIRVSAPKKITVKKTPRLKVYKPKKLKLSFKKTKPIRVKVPKLAKRLKINRQ
jgi:hypothetical protein